MSPHDPAAATAPTGLVHDILRMTPWHGPGLRTAVFLKGCAFPCDFTTNVSQASGQVSLAFNAASCLECGRCAERCANRVHRFEPDADGGAPEHIIDRQACSACGTCAALCPGSAVQLVGRELAVADVLRLIAREDAAVTGTRPALTITGGDPMQQPAFTVALAQAARDAGWHVVVSVMDAFDANWDVPLLAAADLVHVRLRAADGELHQHLTGRSITPLVAMVHRLAAHGAPLVLRAQVAPGINDTSGNFRALADLAHDLPNRVGVELMPFPAPTNASSLEVRPQAVDEHADPALLREWQARLAQMDCAVRVIGLEPAST